MHSVCPSKNFGYYMFGPRRCASIDKAWVMTEVIRLAGKPVEVEGSLWRGSVRAASGRS
jgi:hypothetical protein